MECTSCRHFRKHDGERWENTPCATCRLTEDSHGTFEYSEGRIENATWDPNRDDEDPGDPEAADSQCPAPFSRLVGEDPDDPRVPLSALISAMSLWISLSLPARRTIQMRMKNLPYSEIGRRLGCTRQAAEKLVAQVLAKQPLLQSLLPAKSAREASPLTATRKSAIADYVSFDAKQ